MLTAVALLTLRTIEHLLERSLANRRLKHNHYARIVNHLQALQSQIDLLCLVTNLKKKRDEDESGERRGEEEARERDKLKA